ncbi:MAG: UDP-N-acetylmuramate dehydrogenase [Candidatus Krumholzibacteriia bacterium]
MPTTVPWPDLAEQLNRTGVHARSLQPLAELTTFRIGGPAGLVCWVKNPDHALRFLDLAHAHALPWTCLGGGSNILADDAGYAGAILRVAGADLEVHGDAVRAGAGWDFDALIAATLDAGLSGLEFASGIPGTLGGAVVGNAGCYGHEIGEFVREATVLRPNGRLEVVGPEEFAFTYRSSALKERADVVLDVLLQLRRGALAAAAAERADHLQDRRRKHPWDLPCAGSYFKNLPPLAPGERRRAAGQLLEIAGAKAMREGDAGVYEKHANIIVNLGRAGSADVLRLADRMRTAVWDRFGERLEEEVRHLRTPNASLSQTSE